MNKKRWTDYFIVRLLISLSAGVATYIIHKALLMTGLISWTP